MHTTTHLIALLLSIGGLFVLSVIASKASSRLGIPALLIFLAIGMVAGSEGIGRIEFSDYHFAHLIGTLALVAILFSGGLDTEWQVMKPVFWPALSLATFGVIITASLVAVFAFIVLNLPWQLAVLLGAVVSPTDAAAVFGILRSKGVNLRGKLSHLIELESGSNDPMAVFLTAAITAYILTPGMSASLLLVDLIREMLIGALSGIAIGYVAYRLINSLRLDADGLYPVLTFGFAILSYAIPVAIGGNGFLACYLAGLTLGSHKFVHKISLTQFHEGVAWLMQIIMFLCLGLLVYPSRLAPFAFSSTAAAFFLILIARPLAVWISLLPFRFSLKEKAFISWVGLRGAVPIILAAIPVTAGVKGAEEIFNLVFFAVAFSVMLQGVGVGWVARKLSLTERRRGKVKQRNISTKMLEIKIPADSSSVGKTVVELNLPDEILLALITRANETIIPRGATKLQAGDVVLLQDRGLEIEEVLQIIVGIPSEFHPDK